MLFTQVEAFRFGENLVRVVGHRGAWGILAEDSMTGFEISLVDPKVIRKVLSLIGF